MLLVSSLNRAAARVINVAAAIVTGLLSVSLFGRPYVAVPLTYLGYPPLLSIAIHIVFGLWLAFASRRITDGQLPPGEVGNRVCRDCGDCYAIRWRDVWCALHFRAASAQPETDWVDWISRQGKRLKPQSMPAFAIEAACEGDPPSKMFVLQPGEAKPGSDVMEETIMDLKRCVISLPVDFTEVTRHGVHDAKFPLKIWKFTSAV